MTATNQQPVAEICSASHDDAQFGERAIKPLCDISGFEYGTPLYAGAAPAAVAPQGEEWRRPTTYLKRFGDAIALLCHGRRPEDQVLSSWLDGTSDVLQQFAVDNGPAWAQGIGLIDAATIAADQPTEGVAHEMRAAAAPALEAPAAPAAPNGWKLVPVKPTIAMLLAGDHARISTEHQTKPQAAYAAMLAAAPQAPAAPSGEVISANCEFATVRWLHQTSGKGGGDPKNSYSWPITGEKVFLAASAAPSTHAGLLAAAAHIQAKAQAHLDERGSYDPDTGAVEMSDANQEHFNTLDELADEIRMMADKAAPASCDRPPAGWTCTRAPGHDGPCAAAPAAPVVDAGDQVLGEWPRVSGVGRDAESPRTLLLYLQTEASDDELRAIHDALLDGGALATHALSELMHIGYRVEGGKLVPPENLSVRASEFFGVTAVAAKATAVHSDDVAVDRFAVEMKAKLAAARAKGRGGWETCPPEVLSRMLREHADKGDPRDVANFCMFLCSLGQPISVAAPAAPAVDAISDTALLDAMERERIAVIPEFEGPWDAQIFGEDESTLACGSGATPRKAIAEALASLEARKAHDAAQTKEGGA
ncbi:hypothetical protein [Delftia sp. UGAL515B_04]|nr:hypothetical protein [Delftia sp. UGAL515B_04]WON87480.1 hypothetical protein OK021_22415 [Delftia sp. UGAL515B_04]